MHHAVFYSSAPKSRLAAAFTFAAAIHLSAIALASWHRQPVETIFPGSPDVVGIDVGDPGPPPEPEKEEPQPDIQAPSDFVDARPPRPSLHRQVPVRPAASGSITAGQNGPARTMAISAPRPDYPYEARSRHITGSGSVLLTIDTRSGFVVDAVISQSIGNPILDHSALSAFRRWRFKPGTVSRIKVPITFTLTGAQL